MKGYNYSRTGRYFITICTHQRECLFGEVENGKMHLNDGGKKAVQCIQNIPEHHPYVKIHESIVMPNHIHILMEIVSPPAVSSAHPTQDGTSGTIGSIVRGFKVGVTKWFRQNHLLHTVWQRGYHDHIIRDDQSYHQILEYTRTNPSRWSEDRYHPL